MRAMRSVHRETRRERAQRIADAYGLVLVLILATFGVTMTLPPEGWGGRVTAVVFAVLTAVVAFASSGVAPRRVRLATGIAVAADVAAVGATALSSDLLL